MSSLLPIVAGFVLTTVLGGALGFFFQRRTWNHQHSVQIRDQRKERAGRIFEEVSRLMDRRLYRLRLLYWSLPAGNSAGTLSDLADQRMEYYREILFEWNDGINRNLALIQQYFGDGARRDFDRSVGAEFVALGAAVERLWGDRHAVGAVEQSQLHQRIDGLNAMIYRYNVRMIDAMQTDSDPWNQT